MNTPSATLGSVIIFSILIILASCETQDPGPIQQSEKEFAIIDFDRLEMGSGFDIEVRQANTYRIKVEGDRRNLDDLDVYKSGSTLIIKYDDNGNRHHETKIRIEMPYLRGVNFSGGSTSEIEDFESDQVLDLYLSGGSVSQLEAGYRAVKLVISGGSTLSMYGLGDEIDAEISGASVLTAFDYPVRQATVNVSGASHGKVTVTDALDVDASGASALIYRGSPDVNSSVSGASTVQRD